jgi:diguanylate cyclase (GGDEF)-like protein/PAS domain S-box-containing protein
LNHQKFLFALAVGTFTVLLLVVHLIWSGYRDTIRAAESTTRGYAATLEARLETTLRHTDATLLQLTRTLPLAVKSQDTESGNAHLDTILKTGLVKFPELTSLWIFDGDGNTLYTSNGDGVRLNVADRAHFRQLRDNPRAQIVFSEVIMARSTGRPGLAIARAVRDAQGGFRGAAVALVELNHLQNLFKSLDVGDQGNVAIYRSDDFRQVLRWPEARARINIPLPPQAPVRSVLTGGTRTATAAFTAATDGIARIYSFHALEHYPFFVAVGVARAQVLSGWWQRSLITGVSALLALVLLSALLLRLWRGSRERAGLAAIVEASTDAIVSRDTTGKVLSWNRGAERLFGYSAAEMTGQPISVLVPPELRQELRLGEEHAAGFQARSHDSVRLAKGGRRIDVSISAAPIRDAAGGVTAVAVIFRDITERKQSEEARARLAAIAEGSNDAIFIRDAERKIVYWNEGAGRLYGYTAAEILGKDGMLLVPPELQEDYQRNWHQLRHGLPLADYETVRVRKDGTRVEVSVGVTLIRDRNANVIGTATVARDITERVRAERHIVQLATRDALTGLANRETLMKLLHEAITRAALAATRLALMYIDLDRFKAINDTLGHSAGDELLRECARRLTDCVREGDVVARLGGDEFVVLLSEVTDTTIVAPIADRMIHLLTVPYRVQDHEALASASIGVCLYPDDGADVETLMKNADIAMYHAKSLGRNNYQFYREEMNQRMLQRAQLERELHAAVDRQEFVLHYQPQASVASGEILGVESLLRWRHPTRGMLAPADFIATAEETGLIASIGEWVLSHACAAIVAWRAKGVHIPYIVVNVSPAQLHEGLVATVREALVRHGIEAGWLMLEITETMLMERVEEAISILQRIRELGVRIAMDDFGTGYSSLSVLQRLPLDTLKIDRSFVRAIDEAAGHARAVAIIGAIIAIAKELNLNVVAEGVETPTQLALLRTLNCDAYQGYVYSVPVDTLALETRLAPPAPFATPEEAQRTLDRISRIARDTPVNQRKVS